MTGRVLRWAIRGLLAAWGWRIDHYNARHWDKQ